MERTDPATADREGIGWGWWAALALLSVPLLRSRYFLTQDGPTHLHNARIILDRLRGDWGPYESFYVFRPALDPNWFDHAVLVGLLIALPPWMAEKTLLLAYVFAFALGFRYLARSVGGSGWVGLLAVPFAYHVPLQMGFYNFAFSIALFPWVVGWWWRRIERWSLRETLVLGGALFLLYFCHPVGLVFTGMALLAGWLVGRGAKPLAHLGHLALAGIPVLLLLLSFLGRQGGAGPSGERTVGGLAVMMFTNTNLVLTSNRELYVGAAVALFMCALLVIGVERRLRVGARAGVRGRPMLVFGTLAAAALLLYFVIPDQMGGGTYMTARLQVWPWLLSVPLLAAVPWGVRGAKVIGLGALLLATALLGLRWNGYGQIAQDLELYLQAGSQIEDGSLVLPLSFDHNGRLERVGWSSENIHWFVHAAHYLGAERPIVFLNNYEAHQPYFPVRWKAGWDPYYWMALEIDREPPCLNPAWFEFGTGRPIERVIVWGLRDPVPPASCGAALSSYLDDRPRTVLDDGWVRVYGQGTGEGASAEAR